MKWGPVRSLHILVHARRRCLGSTRTDRRRHRINFAINYLSRFVLTMQLLPMLAAAGQGDRAARIVIVSGAAQGGKVYFDDVNLTSNSRRCAPSCRFAKPTIFSPLELARRLSMEPADGRVTVTCLKSES